MPVAPVPVVPAIDVAKLGHSMIDLAPTEFTRDAIRGRQPEGGRLAALVQPLSAALIS